ncbi:MAG: hypothetical protein KBA91_02460 [Candidatus Moranbacteria bacterium]|nr:hypothetical protein [Candidatus Moranbacteria bacterium]
MLTRTIKIAGFILVAVLAFRYGEVLRGPLQDWVSSSSPDFLSYEYSHRNPNLDIFFMASFNIGFVVFVWRLSTMYALAFGWDCGDIRYAYTQVEELAKAGRFLCISALVVSFLFTPFLSTDIEGVRIAWLVLILVFIPYAKIAISYLMTD